MGAMKPLTVDNADGRTLLALRAGPMTPGELSARVGASPAGWLSKAGYIEQDDSGYRITEAGRAACPYRNPLAAPGVVPAATYRPEIDMSKEPRITRQQVLAVIQEAGTAGISKADLVAKFDHLAHPDAITSHLVMLKKDEAVSNPSRGLWVSADAVNALARTVAELAPAKPRHATREEVLRYLDDCVSRTPFNIANGIGCTEDSTKAVLAGLYAGLKVDRTRFHGQDEYSYFISAPKTEAQPEALAVVEPAVIRAPQDSPAMKTITTPAPAATLADLGLDDLETLKMPAEAFETIEIKGVECQTALPIIEDVHLINPDDVEFAIFSSGGMDIYCEETTVTLNKEVLSKLRAFLGLFVGEPA